MCPKSIIRTVPNYSNRISLAPAKKTAAKTTDSATAALIYLPLITANCVVLGVSILNIQKKFTLLSTVFYGFSGAVGFALAIVIFAGLRERIELMDVPNRSEASQSA